MTELPLSLEVHGTRLRPMRAEDVPALSEQLAAPGTAEWLAAVSLPFTAAEAAELLAFAQEPLHGVRVLERASGDLAGCIALRPSLWFWLAPAQRRQGLMRGCLGACIAACFARPAPPLLATSRADNAASLALLHRLGFSPLPAPRRMFFRSTGRAQDCTDLLLTPEQWHALHPPRIVLAAHSARPVTQKDLPAAAQILGQSRAGWVANPADPARLRAFIEQHRCRAPGTGLFLVEAEGRGPCGLLLMEAGGQLAARAFRTPEAEAGFLAEWAAQGAGGKGPAEPGGT